jgi:protein tyrosine phosphatase (PTP) superfamily phosphohydrolase (DUF442 family)
LLSVALGTKVAKISAMRVPHFLSASCAALTATICSGALLCIIPGCAANDELDGPQQSQATVDFGFQAIDSPNLPRLLKLSDQIFSGAEPKVEQAFADLAQLGVKTIIGVDGARPKIEWAAKYGMSYVHIPIGYDGVNEEQGLAFAYVMKKKDGPFYFHCHHGRHRGPAAAAIAFMASEGCGSEGGVAVLNAAQTSPNYSGLWRDIKAYQPPAEYSAQVDLPQIARVSDFNTVMAVMDRSWDEVKLMKKAGWKASAEHPDLDPKHTALIFAQTFEDLNASSPAHYAAKELFAGQMKIGMAASADLNKALAAGDTAAADVAYTAIGKSCKKCHFEYRDQ